MPRPTALALRDGSSASTPIASVFSTARFSRTTRLPTRSIRRRAGRSCLPHAPPASSAAGRTTRPTAGTASAAPAFRSPSACSPERRSAPQALPHLPLRRVSRRRPGPRPRQAKTSLPLFRITKGEAEHLRNLGYRLPARCKACRAERRARKKAIERRSDEDGSILDEILNGVRDLIKPLA